MMVVLLLDTVMYAIIMIVLYDIVTIYALLS